MLDHIQKLPELKGCNILEFADDGYSGADFNRPNFVKMMDLVKAGKIQIIVKLNNRCSDRIRCQHMLIIFTFLIPKRSK